MPENKLIETLKNNQEEVKKLISEKQDWKLVLNRVDRFFQSSKNPSDELWNDKYFKKFKAVYFEKRDSDKGMSNIIIRTLSGMPGNLQEQTKIIFLQMAEVCCLFNAAHKVNFTSEEVPEEYGAIKLIPAKTKGIFTYADPTPSIYKKISLTFDYWVPKLIEWIEEIRTKKLNDWKGESILQHESCTDFMRICLLFVSDPLNNPPVAKTEDRKALLKISGEEFTWIKKSANRENILTNNGILVELLTKANKESGLKIPLEAWSRIQQTSFIKAIIK